MTDNYSRTTLPSTINYTRRLVTRKLVIYRLVTCRQAIQQLVTQRLVTYRLASVANQLRRVLSLIYYNIGLDTTTTYTYLERTKRTRRTRRIGTRTKTAIGIRDRRIAPSICVKTSNFQIPQLTLQIFNLLIIYRRTIKILYRSFAYL